MTYMCKCMLICGFIYVNLKKRSLVQEEAMEGELEKILQLYFN